jgi:hypothetical protein
MVCLALTILHLVAVVLLLREPPRKCRVSALDSVREAPRVVRSGLRLAAANVVLLALLGAEAAIALAMIGFESLVQLRLADLLGSEEQAGALMSPVAAAGWAVYAGGAAVGGWLSARIGVGRAVMATHVAMAIGVVAIGLATGPAGVVLGYFAAYGIFGGSGPLHASLVHREAEASNRTTVPVARLDGQFRGLRCDSTARWPARGCHLAVRQRRRARRGIRCRRTAISAGAASRARAGHGRGADVHPVNRTRDLTWSGTAKTDC